MVDFKIKEIYNYTMMMKTILAPINTTGLLAEDCLRA